MLTIATQKKSSLYNSVRLRCNWSCNSGEPERCFPMYIHMGHSLPSHYHACGLFPCLLADALHHCLEASLHQSSPECKPIRFISSHKSDPSFSRLELFHGATLVEIGNAIFHHFLVAVRNGPGPCRPGPGKAPA